MDTLSAFAKGNSHRNSPLMVFDWDRAAKLIKESGYKSASAGLDGDWEWTGGTILSGGKPDMESYTYLASTWAMPQIRLNNMAEQPCWCYQSERPRVE